MTRSEVYNNVDNRNQQNSSFERAQHDGKVQSFIYDSQITGTLFKIHHNHIFKFRSTYDSKFRYSRT